jgi:hypothetical protein
MSTAPPAPRASIVTLALALPALAALAACAHPTRLSIFDEAHRPRGYHWSARPLARSGAVEYYGVDPSTGWTVYVGPDGVYYTFAHAPPITTEDLHSYWDPHDVPRSTPAAARDQRPSTAAPAPPHHAGRTRS